MGKITEKDVIQLLEERVEKLKNKIKRIESALLALSETADTEIPKLHKKEKKLIREAKSEIKKDRKKMKQNDGVKDFPETGKIATHLLESPASLAEKDE